MALRMGCRMNRTMDKTNFTINLSITFSKNGAERRRKGWYSTLIKMIIMRVIPLIIIFQRVFHGRDAIGVKYLS